MKLGFSITILLLLVGVATVVAQETTTEEPTAGDPPAAAPPAAPSGNSEPHKNYAFTEALSYLAGAYDVNEYTHETYRPTWASMWPVSNEDYEFALFFWPPKHCHAIHICVIEGSSQQKMQEFNCQDAYIKIYPHIGKLYFKASNVSTEEALFLQDYSLHFLQDKDAYLFKVQSEFAETFNGWKKAKKVTKSWNLKGKQLLILTNSRLCEVNKPGSKFVPIFDNKNTPEAKKLFPNWMTYKGDQVFTDAIASYSTGKRTVDLLSHLKNTKYTRMKLGSIAQRCNSYEKIGITGSLKPVFETTTHVSVASYEVGQKMDSGAHVLEFEVSLTECQWIRIWVADMEDIQDYNKKFKPANTLDLFITEGFYVAPGSDQAEPLPDSRHMETLKLTFHPEPNSDQHPLVEMSLGNFNGEYLFRQYFYSAAFGARTTTFHVIKSPTCQAHVFGQNPFRYGDVVAKLPNYFQVASCKYGRFMAPPPPRGPQKP
uniref:Glycosyltransferase family 92 protein n=2 Tax=Caenorhabditis japonica TaxID=281687 RepID=A0A8R1E3E1_CAEJA